MSQDGHIDFAPTQVGGEWFSVSATSIMLVHNHPNEATEVWALDSFSAHCWHTFSELSDILSHGDDTATVPLGLIESAWGGTEVQNWAPNATLDAVG